MEKRRLAGAAYGLASGRGAAMAPIAVVAPLS